MSLRTWILTVLAVLLPTMLTAQVDDALEEWVAETDNEAAIAAWVDEMSEMADTRPNINDTAALAAITFLSPLQQQALKNYIALYGQLLSHKELRLIPVFDSSTIKLMESLTAVEPIEEKKTLRLANGHHSLTTGIGSQIERASGYDDGRYAGDPLHAQLVYSYNLYNRINIRLTADKDPTERWGKGNYYGYHLMLRDFGRVERLVVGRYSAQFGQGLTVWTGLKPFNMMGVTPMRMARGIGAASTFYEDDYLDGIAATVRLARNWHTSAFVSKTHGRGTAGGHIEYRKGNLIAGITASGISLDSTPTPSQRLYNRYSFRGKRLINIGVDAIWQWRRLTLYGEAAICDSGAAAAIAGSTLYINDHTSIGISYRNYGRRYYNLTAQPYAIGSTQGENGWTLDAKARLPLKIDAMLNADIHAFPSLHYGSYRPSYGTWLRTQASRTFGARTTITLRYTYRQKERNIPNASTTTYEHEGTLRQQLQANIRHSSGRWMFDTKAVLSRFESVGSGNQKGWAIAQQVRHTYRSLQATASVSLFNVDGYYARIYMSESNIRYNFNMPSLYGEGLRAYITLRCSLDKKITLAGKYAITHYFDRNTVGSGAAATQGPNRQTFYIQLQCKM